MRPKAVFAFSVSTFLAIVTVSGAACTITTGNDPANPVDAAEPPASAEAGVDASVADAALASCDAPIVAPPSALSLSPFYAKYLDADGIPVVSSAKATDAALRQSCKIVRKMLSFRPDVRDAMKSNRARLAVMARTEKTTDVPEHADLQTAFPETNWDERARGLGGTVARPATSCAEENVLCEKSDRYLGENILVHELAHGMVNLGVVFVDKTFQRRLDAAFAKSTGAGKWRDTYAGTNTEEYFAEGVQSYFDTNIAVTPANGIHNEVSTRKQLAAYDPDLHALVAEVFGPEVWTPVCP